ncbi:SH3 and multiple ankyrin repeat domains protein 3-like [Pteropus vampyrus]|uniref:SH3 and multiple ankyrin repeat domains protein 3-like n=1 Tax=Pteropus vampyrus TaxID=132908 RepID=A0A6P6C3I1_PTEVA|nr:SH3 and multiple ankyrin repeat domains protein 3-like [Pteropus vampyrus]
MAVQASVRPDQDVPGARLRVSLTFSSLQLLPGVIPDAHQDVPGARLRVSLTFSSLQPLPGVIPDAQTPLTLAAQLDDPVEVIKALRNGGAHLDFRAKDGMTALHKAVRASNQVALKTLLDLGASPDYKDSYGLTPLYHTAIVGGDPGCCELLLHEHAAVSCKDENGWHEVHQVRAATPAPAQGRAGQGRPGISWPACQDRAVYP